MSLRFASRLRIGIAMLMLPVAIAQAQSDAAQARGRMLYRQGTHAEGRPLQAVSGDSAEPLPAAFVACANCHGPTARGKTEAGTTAGDIRWDTLSKPYETLRSDGRRRAPYDATLFSRALTAGKDSGGFALDASMPRYTLSAAEVADLLAYLQHLDPPGDDGVSDETIRIGIALPDDPRLAAQTQADRQDIHTFFDEINRKGGLFRRRLELIAFDCSHPDEAPPVLAVLGRSAAACREPADVPVLSAIADSPARPDRYRFALYPATIERLRLLAGYALALEPAAHAKLALVYPEKAVPPALLDAAIAALRPVTAVKPVAIDPRDADHAVTALRATGANQLLLLGPADAFDALADSAKRQQWQPLFLWTDMPAQAPTGIRAVALQPDLDDRSRPALLAAAQVLVIALENAGREVGRESLVETLEALHEIRSGVAPPGAFTGLRHSLAPGLYAVPQRASTFRPEPAWLKLD